MKKSTLKTKSVLSGLLLAFSTLTTNAQKLPAVQQASLRAPANVKIDGNPAEWGAALQAYNHATDVFYTMANDDDNLYLTIQAADPEIIKKILYGNITFTINTDGKKDLKDGASITYPVFENNKKMVVNFKSMPVIVPGSAASVKLADSFADVNNKKMADLSKMIKTSGIKTVDTLISVYNQDGIRAAAAFDNKMVYTCELAISLKNLQMTVSKPVKFAYNIRLNETENQGITITKGENGEPTRMAVRTGAVLGQPATDFWGEYTLAKK